ncbi:MAG TPA: VanZ family protein [Burkholderiales bacterium]|nr:VanZ family protein [Burkholderiales bacterium]
MRESPLARFLFVVYVLLVVYASLYPLSGWTAPGVSAFAYLGAPWPRYVTAFDVGANVVGYLPYGFLCVLALYPRQRGGYAVLAAVISGAALSIAMEATQSFLPTRVASNLDVLCNLAGTVAGAAVGAPLAGWLLHIGPLRRLRALAFLPGAATDVGLVLLGLWLFAQLDPAMLLFGVGDLRDLLQEPAGRGYAPAIFVSVEAFIAAANLAAVCLLASAIAAPGTVVRATQVTLVAAALAVKTLAFAILMRAEHVFAWLTPGALRGLAAGLALALSAVALPRTARLALSAVLIMAATVLVNLAPENPYFAETLRVWRQGHFLNFNGLTRVVASAWPFAALVYLIYLSARRGREPVG